MTIAETKSLLVAKAKVNYECAVLRRYGVNRTLIALMLGGAELDAMKTEFSNAKKDYEAVLAAIDSIEDADVLAKFATDTDAKMATFIGTKVKTDLTTDQALAISRAIQAAKR